MSSQSSAWVNISNINSWVESGLRTVPGTISNNQSVSNFKIHFDTMKDGLVLVDWSPIEEREVITIDLNG